jgi:hypothetical protein
MKQSLVISMPKIEKLVARMPILRWELILSCHNIIRPLQRSDLPFASALVAIGESSLDRKLFSVLEQSLLVQLVKVDLLVSMLYNILSMSPPDK